MYYIIYNPTSGNGNGKKAAEKVFASLREKQMPYVSMCTEYAGHAAELAQKAAGEKPDAVIAIGGDGTISEVVRGMSGSGIALGIIAAGTGNDFIKTAKIPKDTAEALNLILNGESKSTDIGFINGRAFINECGTGFDVMVLDNAEKAKQHMNGLLPYLWGVIRTIIHFKSIKMTYTIEDGNEITDDLLVFAAGNGGIIGGGIPMCPKAEIDDGYFDIVIIKSVKKYKMPLYLVKLLMGKVLTFKETSYLRARKVSVSAPGMRVNIDGEIVSMDKAEIELIHSGLRIFR